jgi:hypothetical protein
MDRGFEDLSRDVARRRRYFGRDAAPLVAPIIPGVRHVGSARSRIAQLHPLPGPQQQECEDRQNDDRNDDPRQVRLKIHHQLH